MRVPEGFSPEQLLLRDEALRLRRFMAVVVGILVMISSFLPWLKGEAWLKEIFYACMALSAGLCVYAYWRLGQPGWYSSEKSVPIAAVCTLSAIASHFFFGFYSPAPIICILGVYFFSLCQSPRVAALVYAMLAVSIGGLAAGVALEVLPDTGIVSVAQIPMTDRLVMIGILEFMFAFTYLFARMSQSTTLRVVRELERALQGMQQRDAMLDEANLALVRALRPGEGRYTGQLVGEWRLGSVLGRGGMGEVYEAAREPDGALGAMKILQAPAEPGGEEVRRFLREAEVLKRLSSRHVVRIFDSGISSGVAFIVMERLRGRDLAEILRERRLLDPDEVVALTQQVAAGLEAARLEGIIHRDIKPSNLFFCQQESGAEWRVLDFGVSKLIGAATATVTQAGLMVGTVGYMAPEQASGEEVAHQSDVFALGLVAYRAITGHPAYSGRNAALLLRDLLGSQPSQPSQLVPVPRAVDHALALALAKRPSERVATAVEFADLLEAAVLIGRLEPKVEARALTLEARYPWQAGDDRFTVGPRRAGYAR